jgi:hypothetical protein
MLFVLEIPSAKVRTLVYFEVPEGVDIIPPSGWFLDVQEK